MNLSIQIPSTRPRPKNLASPRRNLISTRTLSPRKRVQQIRKLPALDTRSLIANPNLEYSQPAYILEQKFLLTPEVDALRKEVSLLRENYQILLNALKEKEEIDIDNNSHSYDDIYDEIAQHDLSQKLSQYQAELEELEHRISSYNSTLTDETEKDLNNYVTSQRQIQTQLESQIEMDLKLTEERNDQLIAKTSTNYSKIVDENNIKISQLMQLLKDLREEESLMLKLHQDKCQSEPSTIEANQEINSYLRKLQMVQHTRAKKLVDMRKLQKEQQQEKAAILAIKQTKEETEKKRQQRIAFHDIYKKQANILAENSRATSQIKDDEKSKEPSQIRNDGKQKNQSQKQDEEKPITTLVKTRRKHKHKHWHHRRPSEEPASTENEANLPDEMVVKEDLDLIQKPPITFKTEVEKVDTLHIGRKSKLND